MLRRTSRLIVDGLLPQLRGYGPLRVTGGEQVTDQDPFLLGQIPRRDGHRFGVDRRVVPGLAGVIDHVAALAPPHPGRRVHADCQDKPGGCSFLEPSADGIAHVRLSRARRAQAGDDLSAQTSQLQNIRCCDDRWNPSGKSTPHNLGNRQSLAKNGSWSTPSGHRFRVAGRPATCGRATSATAAQYRMTSALLVPWPGRGPGRGWSP